MAAFMAICGVPMGWMNPSGGIPIGTGRNDVGDGGMGEGIGEGMGEGMGADSIAGDGEAGGATAHEGGSGSAAWSSSGKSSAMIQPLPVWVPL